MKQLFLNFTSLYFIGFLTFSGSAYAGNKLEADPQVQLSSMQVSSQNDLLKCNKAPSNKFLITMRGQLLSNLPFSNLDDCKRALAVAPQGFYLEPLETSSGNYRVLPLPPLAFDTDFGGSFSLQSLDVESEILEYLRSKDTNIRIMQSAFLAELVLKQKSADFFDAESLSFSAVHRYNTKISVSTKMIVRSPLELLDQIGLVEGWDGHYSVPTFFATSNDGTFSHLCMYRNSHISEDRAHITMKRPLCKTWITNLNLLLEKAPVFLDSECSKHLQSLTVGNDDVLDIKPNNLNIKPASQRFDKFYVPATVSSHNLQNSKNVCSKLIATAVNPVLSVFKRDRVEFSEDNFEDVLMKYGVPY